MRPTSSSATSVGPEPSTIPRRAIQQTGSTAVRRARVTLAGAGFLVYLWVVHSGKAPIGAAAIVVGLMGMLLQGERLKTPAAFFWFSAFVLWGGLGYFYSQAPELTSQAIWEYVKILLIFLLSLNVAKSRTQ